MDEVLRNILLGITLAAPIGPASVAVIRNGLCGGFQRAFLTGVGVTAADLTYMLVVFFGISGFTAIPLVKVTIWSMGALVLFYLGWQSIRDGGKRIQFDNPEVPLGRNPFLTGYLVNISNPMAAVFWLGIFGSLISIGAGGKNPGIEGLLRGLAILIGILVWHTTMSILTQWGKRFVNKKTARVISIAAGILLIVFGLRFVLMRVFINFIFS